MKGKHPNKVGSDGSIKGRARAVKGVNGPRAQPRTEPSGEAMRGRPTGLKANKAIKHVARPVPGPWPVAVGCR